MEIYNSSSTNHTAAFFRLVEAMKRAKQNGRPFCILIGAGCSLSSSVHAITTEQVIKDCLQRMAPGGEMPNTWEKLYQDFVNNVWSCCALEDRREILYEQFKELSPSLGYIKLKELVVHGYIQYIITTNFDMLIDDVLNDVPHSVQVGGLPERKIKGSSDVHLFKVHGDIENGDLRFSPFDLNVLPEHIANKITLYSQCSCLVCGYRGQDLGIMSNLDASPNYSAFWSGPNTPLQSNHYETEKIYDWMRARNSLSNFIYGDILGTFDGLMSNLVQALLGDDLPGYVLPCWENNIITKSLQTNQKVAEIFNNLLICSNEVAETYEWQPTYPFYAEDYHSVLNAYLFFYQPKLNEIPMPLQLPENEVESLLIGIAIEVIARTSGIPISPSNYINLLRSLYDSRAFHYFPDSSFWEALDIVVSTKQSRVEESQWANIENIRLNMNNNGRFTVDVKKPMLQKIADVLASLDLCGLLCPTSSQIDSGNTKKKYKKLLESKSRPIAVEENSLIFRFEDMTSQEYDIIYQLFFKNHRAVLSGSVRILMPDFLEGAIFRQCTPATNLTLSEYIRSKANKMTQLF